MASVIECIPNFSEGRDKAVIQALRDVAGAVPGAALLDCSSDESHNRSVLTLAGSPKGIAEAAFRLCAAASEKIDMTKHSGEHPRMGATDVIPFVPLQGVSMRDCVELSKEVAARIWDELRIPSFLYEESASSPARKNLADVRKGQFEGMPQKLLLPEWAPDFGGRAAHPTAGVTAVGARFPLVAYNVNLDTPDVSVAKAIAKAIRGSSGGFRHCKAIGVMLEGRNVAQVSMNMVNFEGTPLYRAHEAIRAEARRWGVGIIGSEIVGLAPAKALTDCAAYYLQLEDFSYGRQVLEARLLEME
ncbi:MAG: glutamate formimidoyltransferase [Clostridiales bacterium]|jgi:glutamate formiminotransferase|nr:glutamate formimidoyltransferase [Clostridiales bacterium]